MPVTAPAVDQESTDSPTRAALCTAERLAFTIDEALKIIPIGRTTMFALIASGELRTIKLRGRRLIPRSALEDLVGGSHDGAA